MSTTSRIAVKIKDGYRAIYCHWDGYTSYMYPMLIENYNSKEKAEELVSLGNASFIEKNIAPPKGEYHHFTNPYPETSVFYHRDRGEEFRSSFYSTKDQLLKVDWFVYIWEDGKWTAYQNGKEAIMTEEFTIGAKQ